MTALTDILDSYRTAARSEREKGTYFEELIRTYLRHEPTYQDLYAEVLLWSDWAKREGKDARDTGIDLVAITRDTGEVHAIQCKLYAEDHRVTKKDIDSFFTASGKRPFARRLIVTTSTNWSEHAEDALFDQQPPVFKIDLFDLEQSLIDWAQYAPSKAPTLKPRKSLRPHQENALKAVKAGLAEQDRGKLIMACGTGKTFTSLKIAEELAGSGGRVLFLVPSLALLSQTLTEWSQESATPLHNFAVCSDSDVGKKRKVDDDTVQTFTHELRYPATTDPQRLAAEMAKRHDGEHMSVVYATYHSIDVISQAQKKHGLPAFDLIVCDEAHRTTGATFEGQEESAFVRVHDVNFLDARKRLYMTATPRIFGDTARAVAERDNVALYSMDDASQYGKTLFTISFSEAVKRGLLCDYKVIVLAVEESHVNRRIQALLKDGDNQLRVDDASKIIGCWKALSKQGLEDELTMDPHPMQRAVAFCQVIESGGKSKTHKVASKQIAAMFQSVVEAYQQTAESEEETAARLACEAKHVDGSMNATEKEEKLNWLKQTPPANTCRILSNVRCLSEGVDVPALDAVLFLTPRNSQVDVVQSVGRVMRNASGKTRGYIVLPVVIPAGTEPHEALNDNKTYKVVWQVLQALRSHDDRFDAMVNKLDLIGRDTSKMEVIAVTDSIQRKAAKLSKSDKARNRARGGQSIGTAAVQDQPEQQQIEFEIGEIERAIYAKLVQKVGNRHHWEDWAKDIAQIARTHIDRIEGILENPDNTREREAFAQFAHELRDDLNDSITDGEIVEMLAQHLITKPVFDALFDKYSFAQHNPMSKAMQSVLDVLQEHHLEKEAETLKSFYDSVKLRAEGIDSAVGKQKIIVELYDKFFRTAFPRMTERLGIVYTPVEVVDFILHSVQHLLKTEFGEELGSKNVHILDPFTGTGTFVTRLMQSGLISPEQLPHKYRHELHANEIVLLAYYIAAINIESTYHDIVGGDYVPFEGILLTDTFQMYEKEDLVSEVLEINSKRRKRQKALDIRVIVGNPPYSIGQRNENDNAENVAYPHLDARIRDTYAARSTATLAKGLYDSYIRAIRWASDRVGDAGVIGFVTNAGWLDSQSADGLRKCLTDEFSSLHVFHLRGNARTSGETRRKEKDNVFGVGSRAPIAISLLVKNPAAEQRGKILFHDIGDYLSREDKLAKIAEFRDVGGVHDWQKIVPDEHGDWLNQRDDSFSTFVVMGDKSSTQSAIFENYSQGILTARDAWAYNASQQAMVGNMKRMIRFYNSERKRFSEAVEGQAPKDKKAKVDKFIDTDASKISWTANLKQELVMDRKHSFESDGVVQSLYRPFTKQWAYFNRRLNERVYQMPRLFPHADSENLVICTLGTGSSKGFSALIGNTIPNYDNIEKGQCFPLYLYDTAQETNNDDSDDKPGLFAGDASQGERRDAITDTGVAHFQTAYPGETISKEDLFYYIYGILHSPDYRERYADNLSKELPRIPRVASTKDFWAFSQAGRDLAELHLNYETVPMYKGAKVDTGGKTLTDADYRVEKMRYGKGKDKTILHYNDRITVTGIPMEAYDYVVNGKPALDWVVERQVVKTDKASGIVNDANDWAIETMGNPRYPLELFLRVITVSLETMKIVNALPKLDIHPLDVAPKANRA
ncbi:DEAD/DEAH box helicase [Luteimonas sp. e5]